MGVQGEVVREPGEQVLAVRDVLEDLPTGQIIRRVRGYPEIALRQLAPAQRGVQTAGQRVDGVTLGHAPIVLLSSGPAFVV